MTMMIKWTKMLMTGSPSARTPLEASSAHADLDMWAMGLNVDQSEINMIQVIILLNQL